MTPQERLLASIGNTFARQLVRKSLNTPEGRDLIANAAQSALQRRQDAPLARLALRAVEDAANDQPPS